MTMTDPIADMLTRIRNALMGSFDTVDIPSSRVKIDIAKALMSEGFIRNFKIVTNRKQRMIRAFLSYDDSGEPIIDGIKRVSKPGCRVYAKSDKIPSVLNGFGVSILSTSKGIMTDREAKRQNVGGEILCAVW